jgi:mannose-6-phosphate isomerase-like protein (cupin superfamily)
VKIFRFDADVGQAMDKYNSINAVIARISHLKQEAWVNCIHLGPGGMLGYHEASTSQLFLVVKGTGWVRGLATERIAVGAGRVVYWEAGEGHESGTEDGTTAVVIEGAHLEPWQFVPEEPAETWTTFRQ